ncbi:hypothetical protein Tco_0633865, partial [Tanacetum coccineum]
PKETNEMKDFSEFTLAEPKETPEMKDFSEFTLAKPKETPEMKDFSEFTLAELAEPKETPEMKNFSELTLAEPKETPEMKDFSEFTLAEKSIRVGLMRSGSESSDEQLTYGRPSKWNAYTRNMVKIHSSRRSVKNWQPNSVAQLLEMENVS